MPAGRLRRMETACPHAKPDRPSDVHCVDTHPQNRSVAWSLVAGLVVGVPSGWLLAFLAALPFMLGIFFFVLVGLIIGAVMFRFGSRTPRTPSRRTLWLIGSSVTATVLLVSLWTEYRTLPQSVEKRVRRSFAGSFTPQMRAELRDGVQRFITSELKAHYPPGGFPGYLRWAVSSGKFECPRILKASTVEYGLPQQRTTWIIRVGLSLLLLQWTIMSQLLGLREIRPSDAVDAPAGATCQRPPESP